MNDNNSTSSHSASGGSSSSLTSLDGASDGDSGSGAGGGGDDVTNRNSNNASRRKRWLRHARTAKERAAVSGGALGSVGGSNSISGTAVMAAAVSGSGLGPGAGVDTETGTGSSTSESSKTDNNNEAGNQAIFETTESNNVDDIQSSVEKPDPRDEYLVSKEMQHQGSQNPVVQTEMIQNQNQNKTQQQIKTYTQATTHNDDQITRKQMTSSQTSHSSQAYTRPITVTEATASASISSNNKQSCSQSNNNSASRIHGSSFGGVQSFVTSIRSNSRSNSPNLDDKREGELKHNNEAATRATEKEVARGAFNFDESHYVNQKNSGKLESYETEVVFSEDEDDDHYFLLPPTQNDNSNLNTSTASSLHVLNNNSNNNNGPNASQRNKMQQHQHNLQPPPPSAQNTNKFKSSNQTQQQFQPAHSNTTPHNAKTVSNNVAFPPPPPSSQPPRSASNRGSPRRNNRSHHFLQYHQQHTASQNSGQQQSSKLNQKGQQQHQQQQHQQHTQQQQQQQQRQPTLEPYIARLEKFELFSTHQCYYLVACDKHGTSYRIMKMDRTLIERPKGAGTGASGVGSSGGHTGGNVGTASSNHSPMNAMGNKGSPSFDSVVDSEQGEGLATAPSAAGEDGMNAKFTSASALGNNASSKEDKNATIDRSGGGSSGSPSSNASGSKTQQHQHQHQQHNHRRLSEFVFEDPAIYSQTEIKNILDMINDGNRSDDFPSHGSREYDGVGVGGNEHPSHRSKLGGDGGGPGNSGGGNNRGGLKPICKAYGVLGFIRFLDCYYLTLITKRAKVGSIGGNSIYTIKSTETFPLKPAERASSSSASADNGGNDPSSMLLSMWNRGKRSVGLGLTNREIAELRYQGLYQVVDLTKNFFFSYTYDLTRSLQENTLAMTSQPFPPPPFKDMYAWNFFLTRELEECTNSLTSFQWILPVIHGAFIQRKLHDYGCSLNLMLLARRSRHFAGTRYLKRGVSDRGKVANDVEHEQIIHDESTSEGVFSSFLQIRGSIPTFWTQESSVTMPKPPIVLNRVDPTYQATQAHFEDLLKRYGSPIIVVDLVKQSEKREREVIVGNEFRNAIDYINCHIDDQHKILYCALDYSHISKHRNLNVSSSLNDVATWSVNQTGFFCSSPQWKIVEGGGIEPFDEDCYRGAAYLSSRLGVPFFPMEQLGILRTNCIDCLDRTNVAQFSAGVEALGQQLVVMGIRSSPKLDPSSIIVRMLIDMYVEIGDQIALQYGGSEAHKKVASAGANSNIPGPMGKHKELLTSIRRYYSNAFTDRLKQDAMNLFLGYYVPSRHTLPLWELDNDYYLHNFHVNAGRGSLQSMKAYQSMFGVDWNDWEEDCKTERDKRPQSLDHKRNASVGSMLSNVDEQGGRIDRVKNRCKSQNSALSVWWKVAIQSYIQQRMWMQLGGNQTGSSLPPRFNRLYHPTELSHFDKFFARPWATPSRLSHEDQHKSSLDGEMESAGIPSRKATPTAEPKITLFDERVQSSKIHGEKAKIENEDESNLSLRDFIDVHGFSAKNRPSLKQILKAHTEQPNAHKTQNQVNWRGDAQLHYLGSLKERAEPCAKYLDYASSATMPRRSFRPGAREEFAALLSDTTLDSNDVQGIRKLAESAHICQELQTGPYRGINQNESAVRVATTIHSHFNYLEEKVEEGELNYDESPLGLLEKLKEDDLYSVGVMESFYAGWLHLAKAEKSYSEIVDISSVGCKRSDITTHSSMQLYSSFFDESTPLNQLEQAYTTGQKLPRDPSKPLRRSTRPCNKVSGPETDLKSFDESNFILKAASRGINIRKSSSQTQRLFTYQPQRQIPAGFEQINEDLYARKDNKFMVFNGAGVNSWKSPPQPVTKTSNYNFKIY